MRIMKPSIDHESYLIYIEKLQKEKKRIYKYLTWIPQMKYDSNIFDHLSQLSLMPYKKQLHKSCHYFYPTKLAVEN
jgi:hypothetical protein